MQKVAIIGDGLMGEEIFFYLTNFNFNLTWCCKENRINLKQEKFNNYIDKLKRRELITEEKYNELTKNIKITDNLTELKDAEIIIESITEDLTKKSSLIKDIIKISPSTSLIATNSSSIKTEYLMPEWEKVDNLIGLHFFYPVKLKDFVEVNVQSTCSKKTIDQIISFSNKIKKKPLLLTGDNRFMLNKILLNIQIEALNIKENLKLTYRELDLIIKNNLLGVGIFEQIDIIGIDTLYNSILNYTEDIKDKNSYNSLITKLKEKIDKNNLGKKTGFGFYDWNNKNNEIENSINQNIELEIKERLTSVIIKNFNYYQKKLEIDASFLKDIVSDYLNLNPKISAML